MSARILATRRPSTRPRRIQPDRPSPIRTPAITSPLLRTLSEALCFAFNFIRVPTTADRDNADRLVKSNRAVYERVRSNGGTHYPVSAFPMSSQDWRRTRVRPSP